MSGPDRRDVIAGLGAFVPAVLVGTPGHAAAARIETGGGRLLLHRRGEVVDVTLPLPGTASVVRCPPERLDASRGLFARAPGPARGERDGGTVRLIGDGIVVEAEAGTGRLRFLSADGHERLAETLDPAPLPGIFPSRVQGFRIGRREALRGLGQFRDPLPDYRDRHVFIAQANSDSVNPFLVTDGGWGLLWDTDTAAHMVSRGTALDFHSVAGPVVRYHVCLGATPDALVGRYRALTGQAALLPKWAYGYWQSKERYATQAELASVVAEFRKRGLPLDAIVLDWRYWGADARFSGMTFDPATFPDPRAMLRGVHDADVHLLASIWPAVGPDTDLHRELAARGLLLPGDHWSPGAKVIDFTSPEAGAIYWRHLRKGLLDIGVDGLWSDGNEPEFRSTGDRYLTAQALAAQGRSATAGPWAENLLTFSWRQAEDLSRRWREEVPGKRPILLTRKAYSGQAAFGAITWSGDTFASWGTLSNQIVAARQVCLSGLPWWSCDIGGFSTAHRYPEGLADPAYRELYVRWFQFGAFLPIFRAHGTDIAREPWRFGAPGAPAYDAIVAALRQRYALLPYIYSTMARVALDGDTPLRDLMMDFPGDPAADSPTAFLFGRDLLVQAIDRPFDHVGRNIQELIPNAAVTGLAAPAATLEYFEGADFGRKVGERLTDDLKMSWAGYLPESLAGKPFSCRWTGRLTAAESGLHRIVVTARGRVAMMIDGRIVLGGEASGGKVGDANGAVAFKGHEGDGRYEADIRFVAGKARTFRVELRQPLPDAVSLWVEWITPSQRARMTLPTRRIVDVRLPRGRDWHDIASGARYPGGTLVATPVDLQRLPLFARAGAIVPMARGLDRTNAVPDVVDLHVYAGSDGDFVLYDDAGDGEGYRSGQASRIRLMWHDADRRLAIGAAEGRYPGMPDRRRFVVHLHDGGRPQTRVIDHRDAVEVSFGRATGRDD